MARRILAALVVVGVVLMLSPDRLGGEPTTTSRAATATTTTTTTTTTTLPPALGPFGPRARPNPLRVYPGRPGAKFEDTEARVTAAVNFGITKVNVVRWSVQLRSTLPTQLTPGSFAAYQQLGLVDGYSPSTSNTTGDLLHVVMRVSDSLFSSGLSCSLTAPDNGTVLLAYGELGPPTQSTTTTIGVKPRAVNVGLFFPLGVHRGRMYLTCRVSFQVALFTSDTRAVWGIDV